MAHLEAGRRLGEGEHLRQAEAILEEVGAELDLGVVREALFVKPSKAISLLLKKMVSAFHLHPHLFSICDQFYPAVLVGAQEVEAADGVEGLGVGQAVAVARGDAEEGDLGLQALDPLGGGEGGITRFGEEAPARKHDSFV